MSDRPPPPDAAVVPRYQWTPDGMRDLGYRLLGSTLSNRFIREDDYDRALQRMRADAHGDGQMHAIADVNAGLVDDLIKTRLDRALTAAQQRIAQLETACQQYQEERETLISDQMYAWECQRKAQADHDKLTARIELLELHLTAAQEARHQVEPPVQIAERIARAAHASQKDTVTGEPYIHHIERVVAMVKGDEAKAVAWLHDVLEDADIDGFDFGAAGLSRALFDTVKVLTKGDFEETYREYIDHVLESGNAIARVVKVADLRDHLCLNCPARLRPRYESAWVRLTDEPIPNVSRLPTEEGTPR